MKLLDQFATWLRESRRLPRYAEPGLVAYYWDGDVPVPHKIGDLSLTGLYIFTTERWTPGTIVQLTLRRESEVQDSSVEFAVLPCRVIWRGENGVGMRFLPTSAHQRNIVMQFIAEANQNNSETPQLASH